MYSRSCSTPAGAAIPPKKQDIISSRRYREFPHSSFALRRLESRTVAEDRYLLGSGGTLIFDLTIMVQSYFYGSDKPIGVGVGKFGKFGAAKKLRLPGRKKHRHVEESGGVVRGLSSASVDRERERAPLLPQQQHTLGSPVDSRGRSKSPDVRR